MRRRIEERHKREARRTRIDLLLEGVTAIETVYRDALAAPAPAAEPRSAARSRSPRGPRPRRSSVPRGTREAFPINEKGLVRLIALCLALPPTVSR